MVPEPAPRAPGFDAEVCRWVLDDATQLQSLRASLLRRAGPDYLIDVVDHDPAAGLDDTRQNRPTGGGLGLVLARALALEVGWYTTTTTKHVWARFNAPG